MIKVKEMRILIQATYGVNGQLRDKAIIIYYENGKEDLNTTH